MRNISLALALLSCLLMSHAAQAETFKAKVKLKLIAPESLNAANASGQTLSMPIKKLDNGHCTIDAESGSLEGSACLEPSIENPQIDISGRAAQDVSVKLSESHNANNQGQTALSFSPSLYNGYDQNENFQLSSSSHNVSIGGTILQHDISGAILSSQQALHYNVEVLYP